MGNRAVIAFDKYDDKSIGIYLHWHGSKETVEQFLAEARELMGDRLGDESYARARLMQVIGNNIEGNLSFGVGLCECLDCDNYDNGTYVVDSSTLQITENIN